MCKYESKRVVECPTCSREISFQPLEVICEGSPELSAFLQGEANQVHCSSCEATFLYETSILYRDDENAYWVYFMPSVNSESLEGALTRMDQLCESILDEIAVTDQPRGRLTLSQREMIEKIMIHQHGYDDRLIEYVKYQFYQHSEDVDSKRDELFFDFSNSDSEKIMFLGFHKKTGQPTLSLGIKAIEYTQLERHFLKTEAMEKELDRFYRKYYVTVREML